MASHVEQAAVTTVTVDGDCLIHVQGELDLLTAGDVGMRLHAAIGSSRCRRPQLDLGRLRFIDACGLTVLLEAAAYARTRCGSLDVINASAQVRRIIDVTGTGQALGVGR